MKKKLIKNLKNPRLLGALDSKYQTILDEFINSCLTFNFKKIKTLFSTYPELFEEKTLDVLDTDTLPLLNRIEEIFNEFSNGYSKVTVRDRMCTGCSYGGNTKLFTVSYNDTPEKNSQFGFLIKQENNTITGIHECSQYKSYQDKLSIKMYSGKSEEEIIQMKADILKLPKLK